MPVIGVMSPQSAATAARNIAAFRNGLRELGYTEGRNVRIEYRFADGVAERYPARGSVIHWGQTAEDIY
jgi:hypothetical protein